MATHVATDTLERLAAAWDDAGVRWALLRGGAPLGEVGGDVALLVHRDHLPTLDTLLRREGGVSLPPSAYPWRRRFHLGEAELTVVTQLRYGRRPVSSGLEDGCLERRQHDGRAWQLSPTDMFWTVLLHCLLDKKEVSDRDVAALWGALPFLRRPSEAELVVAQLLPRGWSPTRLVGFVFHERWDDLERLAPRLSPRALRQVRPLGGRS